MRALLLLFPLLLCSPATQAVNRCYNPATKTIVFSDRPCEGALVQESKMKLNTEPITRESAYPSGRPSQSGLRSRSVQIDRSTSSSRKPAATALNDDSKKLLCRQLRQQIEQADAKRDKAAGEYRYQYSKNNCQIVAP